MIHNKLQGIIPAIVTPLTKDQQIDHSALRRIVDQIMDNGGNGVMVLGTVGEGPVHSRNVAVDMMRGAVEAVGDRGIVVAGTSAVTCAQSLYLTDAAHDAGAVAVLTLPPFYFNLDDEAILRYYSDYADKSKLPVMIYHIPDVTRRMVKLETVQKLSKHGNIIGIKESSGSGPFFQGLASAFENDERFLVFMGKALLILSALAVGAKGTMTPVGNLVPKLEHGLYQAYQQGNIEKARTIQSQIYRIFTTLHSNGKDLGANIKGILDMRNIAHRYTPDYITHLDDAEASRLNRVMQSILDEE